MLPPDDDELDDEDPPEDEFTSVLPLQATRSIVHVAARRIVKAIRTTLQD
jgi:hypothetical protein